VEGGDKNMDILTTQIDRGNNVDFLYFKGKEAKP
jgi:hypothetical protein